MDPDLSVEQQAAWELHVAVHRMLCGLVIGPIDTLVQPDAVILGDLDDAEMTLNETAPVLTRCGHGQVVAEFRTAVVEAREGRRRQALDRLLAIWEPTAAVAGGSLPLPVPQA